MAEEVVGPIRESQEEEGDGGCAPCYFPANVDAFRSTPTPYYFGVFEVGGTLQWPYGDTTLKFEGVWKKFSDYEPILGYQQGLEGSKIPSFAADALKKRRDHTQLTLGAERVFSLVKGQDTTFYLEIVGIFGTSEDQRGELSIFQRDVFLGIRHDFNDTMGKELTLGLISDLERDETVGRVHYFQRLSDEWKIRTGMELYYAPRDRLVQTGLESQNQDHNFFFNLMRYF